jgi:FkbM family methyltransferase
VFITYAQNFEDLMLWRALKHIPTGFYIDIGAQDPLIDSVSFAFYERGWRGVHVEPVPKYAERLRQERQDETVIQAAVGMAGPLIKFYEVPGSGWSSGDTDIVSGYAARGVAFKELEVPCVSLASILDRYSDREIHWLKIDVEGMEDSAITSWMASAVRPWIVIVEATIPTTPMPSYQDWDPKLLILGYTFAYFDGLNRFYVSDLHKELLGAFASPPNVFDNFALSGTAQNPACSVLNETIRKLKEEVVRLHGTLTNTEQQLDRASEDLKFARVEALQTQRDLFEQLSLSKSEIRKLADQVAKRERRFGEMHQIRVSEAKLARQNAAAVAQKEELLALRLRQADADNEKLQNALASLLASWSWKITQPLRWLTIGSVRSALVTLDSMPLSVAGHERAGATIGSISRSNHAQIVDLLAKDGMVFVEAAYLAILRRRPDPQGATVYHSLLDKGTAKIQILRALVTSPEGAQRNAKLPGLAWRYQIYRLSRLPIVGALIGFVFRSITASNARSIHSIDELLALRGEEFVREAYRVVLCREADDEGLKNYMSAMHAGKSKIQIISALKQSTEGRKVPGRLRRLRRARAFDRAMRLPLIGHILHAWARSGGELVWCESKRRWCDKGHST